ncbi:MAG TPA: hypothetical protein PLQ13_05845 [Candidatus Krumholzibacteria bacterium]|nr:hypothetical protein [Candidatus Krumholzibacteria bacterium]
MALVALALLLSSPLSALAREDRVNGRDGVEGDPGDGLGAIGGGGGSSDLLGGDTNNRVEHRAIVIDSIVLVSFAPDLGVYIIILPSNWLQDTEALECR